MSLKDCFPKYADYHPSQALRAFQYVLLAFIVIGLVLLVTQSLWVPRIVEYILSHESASAGM